MSAADWYARHLGNGRAAPTQQTPYYPTAPGQAVPSQAYAPAPEYYVRAPNGQFVPVQQQQAPLTWQQLQQQTPAPNVDTTTIPRGAITPENFLEMAKFWKGGPGNQSAMECPRCHGVLFRRFQGRMEAAPMCTSCGYNGEHFNQGEYGAVA